MFILVTLAFYIDILDEDQMFNQSLTKILIKICLTFSAFYERMIELGQATNMVDPYFFFGIMEEHF